MDHETDQAIAAAGPRLRELRQHRDLTLEEVSTQTGISRSTLSRLESGGRRASLELLLPLARVYGVTLDELVDAPFTGDPRVALRATRAGDRTVLPLTRRPGGIQAFKIVLDPSDPGVEPSPRTHTGYEWLYVLDGRLRLVLGEHDVVLTAGEAAEFDTRLPHWFGTADGRAVEFLSLFGKQGERAHLRAAPPGRQTPT
ncbi:helix-turn-helix domain-containing protein [Williamsia deligens]|uniref:Helix-turn-helix domain-containing protein n=1 Tax=Williamsia deligens TaxID=321325 RepID=A0ABW3GBP6_9NOCA|nr:XRE family transcriptional regulator [Williamsia deligens]MCP2196040.1 transcriptional regulator, XRE family with cupin sensor [Williamsia deligens]